MNILFTCGGTAGHVNPAVALARIFQERHPGCRVLFVGADGGMETRLVPKEGYPIRTVTITNFHRSLAPADIAHNLGTLMNMRKSKKQARAILDEFQPDLVVGTGGYASFPVVNEAARRKIPTAVHESNAVPGLTTKALAKVVDRVMVGFEESRSPLRRPRQGGGHRHPGPGRLLPVHPAGGPGEAGPHRRAAPAAVLLGLAGGGGDEPQMVDFIAKECYEGAPFRHIHGAGRDFPWMQEELLRRGLKLGDNGIEVREYIYDMPLVMAAADVVLCRAGASTISELTAIAKPVDSGALPQCHRQPPGEKRPGAGRPGGGRPPAGAGLRRHTLYDPGSALLQEPARRDAMVRALNAMAVPDAGEKIYQTLMAS